MFIKKNFRILKPLEAEMSLSRDKTLEGIEKVSKKREKYEEEFVIMKEMIKKPFETET